MKKRKTLPLVTKMLKKVVFIHICVAIWYCVFFSFVVILNWIYCKNVKTKRSP